MRTQLILVCLVLTLSYSGIGQHRICDIDRRFDLSPENKMYYAFLKSLEEFEESKILDNRSPVYFPVVVHMVVPPGYQPVNVAQAQQQIDVLNADFAGRGANVSRVSTAFSALIADTGLRFCLANTDPEGQPTSGITYTETSVSNIATQTGPGGRIAIHYDQLGGKSGWDPSRYINIWIGEYGGILGSASFPGMASFPEEIGLILDPSFFGAIGSAGQSGNYDRGHTLTHEMGHFFGLKHIWGEGEPEDCNDSDDIDDTPNAAGPYFDCPSGIQTSCGSADMYQNFMDLTDDRCLAAFTHGQAQRMQAVAEIYYPQLGQEGNCYSYSTGAPAWFEQLLWSHDAQADKYVIYGPVGLMAQKRIRIYNLSGQLISEDTWGDSLSYLIDLHGVAAGVYIVSITQGDSRIVRKIIVYQ